MSTITDLFNIRIGLGRRSVFVENLGKNTVILLTDERLPMKEGARIEKYVHEPLEEILKNEGITKENIYYIIPPSLYYRNILHFPFNDNQKIEGVVKYEVKDYLPFQDIDCVTDFLPLGREAAGQKILSFSAEKSEIENILWSFGQYRENLKALVPYDIAVFHNVISTVEKKTFIVFDIQSDSAYIQFVKDGMVNSMVWIFRYRDEQYKESLLSQLLMFLRESEFPPVYMNIRGSAGEDFRRLNKEVFEEMNLSYRAFPVRGYSDFISDDLAIELSEIFSLFGALKGLNQTSFQRVNLLKEEFKPRLRGYVSLKDFVALGAILLVLVVISVSNLFMDIRIKKKQVNELKKSISELSTRIFDKPQLREREAEQLLSDIKKRVGSIEGSINRRYSGVELLREISSYLPGDIVIEYTDLIFERERIKFAGKAQTFSDIDRIKESLLLSEYFSEVRVSNTGTTGSTGGFAVTFMFDIKVNME